jgi:hypothetical protein
MQKAFYLFVVLLSLVGCKKDALQIREEKSYHQVNAAPTTDRLLGNAVSLTLKPGGSALINPGGDIMWSASYKISGSKIKVHVPDLDKNYQFTIISDNELHGENGEVLRILIELQ